MVEVVVDSALLRYGVSFSGCSDMIVVLLLFPTVTKPSDIRPRCSKSSLCAAGDAERDWHDGWMSRQWD
ncbi:hypothetical protein M419DRAFT_120699 [Trichoderma reesei RUT C-30]|uniref:Uncharacterized protein n=1 Tax=Hypocrea jecorina (strain ATCC 56765 / BCRC 32924 / NRRL 11460 / Rut C-30) TaxID=1344414 RepID=A0A024RYN6_HYPJR|nr:hypothetical protein M419DRAFT_120699 [Trichoderma reesei RUT C-30]